MVTVLNPLSKVESLLNEFYNPNISLDKRREIEHQLIEFQNQTEIWKECVYNLPYFTNQYLWFFNVSTIENAITRRFDLISVEDRVKLREAIWNTYVNLNPTDSKIQRDKIAQLICLMGKREYPHDHPAYMQQIIDLMKSNFLLGIVLLRVTSEEITSTKDDISSERKKYFHDCVSQNLKEVFYLLCVCLHKLAVQINGDKNITNGDLTTGKIENIQNIYRESFSHDNILINSNNEYEALELLNCVQHLLSWTSLNESDIGIIFSNLIRLSKWHSEYREICLASLTTICELFYRQQSLPIEIRNGIEELLNYSNYYSSSKIYRNKLSELLQLFFLSFSIHSKWTDNLNGSTHFLFDLEKFTFTDSLGPTENGQLIRAISPLVFAERLKIWSPLFKSVGSNLFDSKMMTAFTEGIIERMLYDNIYDSSGSCHLASLDIEELDDDNETEFQRFINQCINVIVLVALNDPLPIWELIEKYWRKYVDNDEVFLRCSKENRWRNISSICQTLVALASLVEENSPCYKTTIRPSDYPLDKLFSELSNIVTTGCKEQSYKTIAPRWMESSQGESQAYFQMTAYFLTGLRALLSWSSPFKREHTIPYLLNTLAMIIIPYPEPTDRISSTPTIITSATAQLMLSIINIDRPQCALKLEGIGELKRLSANLSFVERNVRSTILNVLFSCYVLPWKNVATEKQDWKERVTEFSEFMLWLTQDWLNYNLNDGSKHTELTVLKATKERLTDFSDVLDHFRENRSLVKEMLATVFKPIIQRSFVIFKIYAFSDEEILNCILKFSLSCIRSLYVHLGTNIREMLDVFIQFLARIERENDCPENVLISRRCETLDKLLQMFSVIVEYPGNLTTSLLPIIIQFTTTLVREFLQYNEVQAFSTILATLFTLFDGILQNHWSYFYRSQLKSIANNNNGIMGSNNDIPLHAEEMLTIFNAYGHMLVSGRDPHVISIVLNSLEKLNTRWRLYSRPFFINNLMSSFHHAIINALISPVALHYDLLMQILFTMCEIDRNKTMESFTNIGFQNSPLVNSLISATDLPTFSVKMAEFIQNARVLQNSN